MFLERIFKIIFVGVFGHSELIHHCFKPSFSSDNFKDQIDTILPVLPKQRRTSLFTATLEQDDKALMPLLARAGLRNPMKIVVKEQFQQVGNAKNKSAMPTLLNTYYTKITDVSRKFDYLVKFLSEHKKEKCLVFFTCCAQVDYTVVFLK